MGYAQGSRGYELVNRITGASLLKGFRKRICAAVTVTAIIIIVAGVVEVRDHKSLKSTSRHTSIASPNAPTSTSGAYNGTGLSVLYALGSSLQAVLFYQHSAGSVGASRLMDDVWQQYDQSQDLIVSSDARNGTPIASASHYVGACCGDEVVSSRHKRNSEEKSMLTNRESIVASCLRRLVKHPA